MTNKNKALEKRHGAAAYPGQEVQERVWDALERRVLVPARSVGIDLSPFAVTWTPTGSIQATTFEDTSGKTWIAAEPLLDPSRRGGLIPIPHAHLERLRSLEASGASLDFVVLAHELPVQWKPGTPLPDLVPPAPRSALVEQTVLRTLRRMLDASLGGIRATASVMLAPVAALGALDPVVLGGVMSDDGQLTAWTVVTAWRWDGEI